MLNYLLEVSKISLFIGFKMKLFLTGIILMTLCLNVNAYNTQSIASKIQILKQQAVLLHKDLAELEQDLIYPSTTQVAIYLAKELQEDLKIGSMTLSVDGVTVSSHIYTSDQNKALELGGMQRFYKGNLKVGEHVFSAVIKVFNRNNEIIIFKGEDAFYKDNEPLSLKINLLNTPDNNSPLISLTRL